METTNQYQKYNQLISFEGSNLLNESIQFGLPPEMNILLSFNDESLQQEVNYDQQTFYRQTASQSQPKEFYQNSFHEKPVNHQYKQKSRMFAGNLQKKHKKKQKPDDDDYLPMKRKKNEQLGKNFLPNFTKPFLNLLKNELAKNNIKSKVFIKHQKLEALNWKILLQFFQDRSLRLPILNIFMKNLKLQCLLSKIKQKKVLMEHYKQLRKLKKRLIFILEQQVQGLTNNKNEQFRYFKRYIHGQIPMES